MYKVDNSKLMDVIKVNEQPVRNWFRRLFGFKPVLTERVVIREVARKGAIDFQSPD